MLRGRGAVEVEIEFPIEFLVHGTPVSLSAKRAKSRSEWKARVRSASTYVLPHPHFASNGRMAVTLYYFPHEPMQGDLDNIIKPVLDALSRHIYLDDRQVERIVVQKFELGNQFDFGNLSARLAEAFKVERPVLYVRVATNPFEEPL
jgi:crossover junction endodeoxyribonuclease RusA